MINSKFFQLLQSLDSSELREFRKYLKALYHRQLVALSIYQYVEKYATHPDHQQKLLLATAQKKLLGADLKNEKRDRKKILNALSDLHLWLKEFLLWKEIKQKSVENDLIWAKVLNERKQERMLFLHIDLTRKSLQEKPIRDIWYYFNLMKLNYYDYYRIASPKLSNKFDALSNCDKNLDLFYATAKLKNHAEALNRSRVFQLEDLPIFQQTLVPILNQEEYKKEVLLKTYDLLLRFLKNQDQTNYNDLKIFLFNQGKQLSVSDQMILLTYLLNFISSKVKKGESDYLKEAFLLYQLGLNSGILLQDEFFTPTRFTNIVNIACRVKKHDWAASFIKENKKHLPKNLRESTAALSLGILAFEKGDFQETMDLFKYIEFTDIHQELRARSLQLRSYYETNQSKESISYYAVAFERFIKRNKMLEKESRQAILNFIKFLKILIRNKVNTKKLELEIRQTKWVFFKSWLLKKLNELAN